MNAVTAIRPETWPTLAEMGVTRFHEIAHYTLRQDGDSKDVLKISYKRQKGSLLPESRKYRFGRSLRSVLADGGTARIEHVYEISPYLLAAVAELDRLVGINALADGEASDPLLDRKAKVLTDLSHIERTLAQRIAAADAGTLAAKFADVRRQIEAL